MKKTYTFITCTFGDPFWINLLLERLNSFAEEDVPSILVVDQNRTATPLTAPACPRAEIISFEPNLEQIAMHGHDHASSLNAAIRREFKTSHVVVIDSDCLPTGDNLLQVLAAYSEPVLAGDPAKHGLTHPCFMVFPVQDIEHLDFEEGFMEIGIDTGRLVGLQLSQAGSNPKIVLPSQAGWGRGHQYLDGAVYHHGSGSMLSSPDSRLSKQVSSLSEAYFRKRLVSGNFSPRFTDIVVRSMVHLLRMAQVFKRT